jgi:hypothetical protein
MLLPVDFNYGAFVAILLACGVSMGAFSAPNRAAIMNSLPARRAVSLGPDRGVHLRGDRVVDRGSRIVVPRVAIHPQ